MSRKKKDNKEEVDKKESIIPIEEGKVNIDLSAPPTPIPEISEESKIERAAITSLIFQRSKEENAEALRRKKARRKQEIELLDGTKKTIEELCPYVVPDRTPYAALFPNTSSYFRELFRVNGLSHLNPNEYIKPKSIRKMMIELIYNRFAAEVLPALKKKNPIQASGFRKYKLFQYLDKDGKDKVIEFRDDAVRELETSQTNSEFRMKMLKNYGVPYQTDFFDKI